MNKKIALTAAALAVIYIVIEWKLVTSVSFDLSSLTSPLSIWQTLADKAKPFIFLMAVLTAGLVFWRKARFSIQHVLMVGAVMFGTWVLLTIADQIIIAHQLSQGLVWGLIFQVDTLWILLGALVVSAILEVIQHAKLPKVAKSQAS